VTHAAIDRDFEGHVAASREFLRIPSVSAGDGDLRPTAAAVRALDAANVPSGCRFHPRCPHRFDPCDEIDPPQFAAGGAPEHRAACLLLDPERAAARPAAG
jgi:peptide/nickel transport system ATP-binding protein